MTRTATPVASESGTAVAAAPQRQLTPEEQKVSAIARRLNRDTFQHALRAVLPKYATPERMVRVAFLAINRQPQLLDCTPESLAEAVLTIATWNLEIGRTAHIVPYGSKAQAQVDWKGMIELAIRGKSITSCRSVIVHEHDEFYVARGLNEKLHHVPTWKEDPGQPVGCYAVARFPSGDQLFELMSKATIEALRDRYSKAWKREKGKRGPWESEPLEMWRKTVVRRLLKSVPQNPLLAAVIDESDELDQVDDRVVMGALRGRRSVRGDGGYGEIEGHADQADDDGVVVNTLSAEAATTAEPPVAATPQTDPQPEQVDMASKPQVPLAAPKAGQCEHGVDVRKSCVECELDRREADQARQGG